MTRATANFTFSRGAARRAGLREGQPGRSRQVQTTLADKVTARPGELGFRTSNNRRDHPPSRSRARHAELCRRSRQPHLGPSRVADCDSALPGALAAATRNAKRRAHASLTLRHGTSVEHNVHVRGGDAEAEARRLRWGRALATISPTCSWRSSSSDSLASVSLECSCTDATGTIVTIVYLRECSLGNTQRRYKRDRRRPY
jgi:hypothetical protein